jgi:hypothetical protein
MSVRNYVQYMDNQWEASPLYLFDGKLDERAPEVLSVRSASRLLNFFFFPLLNILAAVVLHVLLGLGSPHLLQGGLLCPPARGRPSALQV